MTVQEFSDAIKIKNNPDGSHNVAQYYFSDNWVMNAYESYGSLLRGISISYMIPYVLENGRYLIPERLDDASYDDTCVFGAISADELQGCKPFDCGYGDGWTLTCEDDDLAMSVAFKMWERKYGKEYAIHG